MKSPKSHEEIRGQKVVIVFEPYTRHPVRPKLMKIQLVLFLGPWEEEADITHAFQVARRHNRLPSRPSQTCSIELGDRQFIGFLSAFRALEQRLMSTPVPFKGTITRAASA
jgi:hypothetical protein